MRLNLSSLLGKSGDSDRPVFVGAGAELLTLVRGLYVFDGLDDNELLGIVTSLPTREFSSGELVYSDQDESDGNAYIVVSGEAEITMGSDISTISIPGSLFGESALIIPDPRSHTVRSLTDLKCLILDQETFMSFASENYELNKVMYRAIQRDFEIKNAPGWAQ